MFNVGIDVLNTAQLSGAVAVMVPKDLQLKCQWCPVGSHDSLCCITTLGNVPNLGGHPTAHVPIWQHVEPVTLSQALAIGHVESEKQGLLQGTCRNQLD